MKNQVNVSENAKSKVIIINILFATSIIIMLLGVWFSIFSVVNNINFRILNSTVSGLVFGLMVLYLGMRYFLSVKKLRDEVYKNSSNFSWNNFKRQKSLSKSR
jgi:uncharacterized protein YacL